MDQKLLNEQVARATGETIDLIEQRGFVPLTKAPVEREAASIPCNNLSIRSTPTNLNGANEHSPNLLARWRKQVGTRRHREEDKLPRPCAAMGYLTCGPAVGGLVEVENLKLVVLYDEPVDNGFPIIRLAGFNGSRVPNGVQWGGPENNKFFKDLSLTPGWGGKGQRLNLASEGLLYLGLQLDRMAYFMQKPTVRQFWFPHLWAGFRPKEAGLIERECDELHQAARRTYDPVVLPLHQSSRTYFGLTLFPLNWVGPWQDRAVGIFADLTEFPKCQVAQLHHFPDDLRGVLGPIQYDFYTSRFRRPLPAAGESTLSVASQATDPL